MAAMTDYLENELFDAVSRGQAYVPPTQVYVALFTSTTTDAGGGSEVGDIAYTRQAVSFTAPSNGSGSNDADVVFPAASGAYGTVTHVAIYDALVGGNMLLHGALTQPIIVNAGDNAFIGSGNLVVALA